MKNLATFAKSINTRHPQVVRLAALTAASLTIVIVSDEIAARKETI